MNQNRQDSLRKEIEKLDTRTATMGAQLALASNRIMAMEQSIAQLTVALETHDHPRQSFWRRLFGND